MFLIVRVSKVLAFSDNASYTYLLQRYTQTFLLSEIVIFAVKIGFTHNVLILNAIPVTLPAQIGCVGRHLLDLIQPWGTCGRAVANESTPDIPPPPQASSFIT